MKHIHSFQNMNELEAFQRSEKLHHEEYNASFNLVWDVIEKKTKGEKVARMAMRIVSSHIAAFMYYYDRGPGDIFVKTYQDLLARTGRLDELEVFSTKFLDSQSRYAEAIYQTYIESKTKKKEGETLPEIYRMFKKLSLCPILEIIDMIEILEDEAA